MEKEIKSMKTMVAILGMMLFLSISYNFWSSQVVKAANQETERYKAVVANQKQRIVDLTTKKAPVINNYYTQKSKPQEVIVTVMGKGEVTLSTVTPGVTLIDAPSKEEPAKQVTKKVEEIKPITTPAVEQKKEEDTTKEKVWPNGDPMWDPYPGTYDQYGSKEVE
jgi:hypothetical protein